MKKFFTKFIKHLTIFDYISITLAAGVILVIGLFFSRKYEYVEVELRAKYTPVFSASKISVGSCQLDGLGRKEAEVLSVRQFEREPSQRDVYLRLKLRAVWNRKKQQHLFKGEPITVGEYLALRLSGVFIDGYIINIEGTPDTKAWEDKIVEARLIEYSELLPATLGVMPWVAEGVKVGEQMQDSQGGVVAEVLDKKVKPAKKIVVTDDGRVLVKEDPIKKDVTLTLKLKTFRQDGINYYLGDEKVMVDRGIPLHLPNITIWPVITKILE